MRTVRPAWSGRAVLTSSEAARSASRRSAREYSKAPEGTLVVSPDNRSRAEINGCIHAELHHRRPHSAAHGRRSHRCGRSCQALDHGSASTSYSSQEQNADRVLIHTDTELAAKDLLNSRMAYVAVSRGAHDPQVLTTDPKGLHVALGSEVSKRNAYDAGVPQPIADTVQPQIVHEQETIN